MHSTIDHVFTLFSQLQPSSGFHPTSGILDTSLEAMRRGEARRLASREKTRAEKQPGTAAGPSAPVDENSPERLCARQPELFRVLFFRRSTMIPRKRTARTAHTMRIIEVSIYFLLSSKFSVHHMLFIIGSNSRMIFIATGPTVTTNSEGRMQKKIGKTSLTPSFAAFSSAICRAWTRI